MKMYGRIEVEYCVRGRWNKVRKDSIKVNMGGVKTEKEVEWEKRNNLMYIRRGGMSWCVSGRFIS